MIILSIVLGVLMIVAMWKIFSKAGEAGWKSIIPVYNAFVLFRIAGLAFFAALIVAIVSPDTRPRILMRFLAALFALFALLSFASDISRPAVDGQGPGTMSLLQHLQSLAPTFVAALQRTIENATGTFVWDPLLTSFLSLPAWLLFLLFAVGAGFLGRPRRRVRIFVNDY